MLGFGPLAFASPWLLLALLALPVLWFLLRVTPPSPRRQFFPAVRLLMGLRPPEETPARTPWWLLLLRLLIAALVILALARPILNPTAPWGGEGPLVLVVDDGWSAALDWDARQEAANALVDQAERRERAVLLLTTAPARSGRAQEPQVAALQDAEAVRRQLRTLSPKPWAVDRQRVVEALQDTRLPGPAQVYWLADGLDAPGTTAMLQRLRRLGAVTMLRGAADEAPKLLLPPESEGAEMIVRAARVPADFGETVTLRAVDAEGYAVASTDLTFEPGSAEARQPLDLPLELRNRIDRLRLEREQGAGAVVLLDERWRRRPVGLVTVSAGAGSQPLLDELYYLERALDPFTEIYRGSLEQLLERRPAVMILADSRPGSPSEAASLREWVEDGGLLLHFAGPRLLDTPDSSLLPVELRDGSRTLGGALAWDRPAGLGAFPEEGPLSGLAVPDDVVVRRQVLAEPALDLAEKTWARLEDGTPLITAERWEAGWSVLVHTTANAEWSNLALSGLFVELLQRVVALSEGVETDGEEALPPLRLLDGFGRLVRPSPGVQSLPADSEVVPGPAHPPGLYGSALSRRALNLAEAVPALEPLPEVIGDVAMAPYRAEREQSLMPWLLTAALLLALLDQFLGLALRGLLPGRPHRRLGRLGRRPRRGAGAAGLVCALAITGLVMADTARAQDGSAGTDESYAFAALEETRLAYVVTGQTDIDEMSRAGLLGLSQMLTRRTTIEPGEPMGVRPGRDELAFFPLVYWPITASQGGLDQAGQDALNRFLEHGGTLLIDLLRPDALRDVMGGTNSRLQQTTDGLGIPPLQPLPPDHVLTRAFYLIQEFPGRYSGAGLWVEETDERRHDGVATVILGAGDWASAWAVDARGRPMAAVVPGGERQREIAYRFGINLVMYALTGNYKADQVHVPYILERLGQ